MTVAVSGWLLGLLGVVVVLALGFAAAAAIGLAWMPAEGFRRGKRRASEPDVHRGVELPDEVPERDPREEG